MNMGPKKVRVQTIYGGLARFGLLLSEYIKSLEKVMWCALSTICCECVI